MQRNLIKSKIIFHKMSVWEGFIYFKVMNIDYLFPPNS
jgi:hypothetical protein